MAIVASSGRPAKRAASAGSATVTTGIFFPTVVLLLAGVFLGHPTPCQRQGSDGGPPPYFNRPLSYRDVEELLAERGIEVDHVSIYRWVQPFAPEFAEAAGARRHVACRRCVPPW